MPTACAGAVATIWEDEFTVKDTAAVVPNLTLPTVRNPVPAMVTWVPPDTGPLVLEREVMVGTGS